MTILDISNNQLSDANQLQIFKEFTQLTEFKFNNPFMKQIDNPQVDYFLNYIVKNNYPVNVKWPYSELNPLEVKFIGNDFDKVP